MSLNIDTVLGVVVDHALASGLFTRVNTHEPKSAPGNGLTAAVWVQSVGPADSGLASTSAKLVLMLRIYQNFKSQPEDAIDPTVTNAVDVLLTAYSGDFQLGGNVRGIDLLGRYGVPLSAQAGYIQQDTGIYRVMEITIPLIINDVWDQVA